MKIFDVSVTVTPKLPVWPGDPAVSLERIGKIEAGDNANVSRVGMGVHTGTHVDAPVHFLQGDTGVDQMPLDLLVGPALVALIPDDFKEVTADAVRQANIPEGTQRVLLKTRNSGFWKESPEEFRTDFVGIAEDGAEELVRIGVKLIGIDYLSIAPFKRSKLTHEILLGARMVVIEGLDLSAVEPGEYQLYCLPLKLGGSDGAPARTILIKE